MLSFTFANKNSLADFGIYIEKMPAIPSPERRVSFIPMPGRSGSLLYDEKSYEDITLSVSCGVIGNVMDKISRIKAWLFESGESDLIFSFSPDRKYIAQVVNRIDFEIALSKISTFQILFHCQPFCYAVANPTLTIIKSGTNLVNSGSVASEPIITVVGSGSVTLQIGEQKISLKDVPQTLILNSVLQEVYDENFQNKNSLMEGAFPLLFSGENKVSWTGAVTKLTVTVNTRWL